MFNSSFLKSRSLCVFISFTFAVVFLCVPVSIGGELQDMINSAKPGATIDVKEGVYKESLVIDKDLNLVGKSAEDVIIMPESVPSGYAVEIKNNAHVSIEGVTVYLSGSQEEQPASGISASKSRIHLRNCKITGAPKIGVLVYDCNSVIENCHIESSSQSAIQAECGRIEVKECTLIKNKNCGLFFDGESHASEIKNLYVEYNVVDNYIQSESVGMTLLGNCSGRIFQNRIIDNDNSAIYIIKGTGKNDIIQNTLAQSNYGIYLELLKNDSQQTSLIEKNTCSGLVRGIYVKGEAVIADILGNTCSENDEHGIYIESVSQARVLNNQCDGNNGQGIYLHGAKKVVVENNTCQRNKRNGLYIEASQATARKNTFNNNEYNGIGVDCGEIQLEENECAGNNGSGIYLWRNIVGSTKNNKLTRNRFYGIYRGEQTVVVTIENNEISGNPKGSIWQKQNQYGDVCSLLLNRKFDELDTIGSDLRKNETRDANGKEVIRDFYEEMAGGWQYISKEYPDRIIEILGEWMAQKPDSIIPSIVLSRLYVNLGWAERGTDWAYKVKDENWKLFRKNLDKAVETIHNAEKLKEKDAHLYCVLITAGMGLGDDGLTKEGFEKGVAVNKYYSPLYFERARTLLPRWSGRRGELEAFADEALKQTEDKYGAILYARIVLSTYTSTYPEFDKFNFSYDKIKQGYEDILRRYPDSKYYMNAYCLFACLNNDLENAKELFEKIGKDYDYVIWRDQDNLRRHYDWVFSENMPQG